MRDYNFRKVKKEKEQKRRKLIYNTGYWPSVPRRAIGNDGSEYYLEGFTGAYKPFLKKKASNKVRCSRKEISNGAEYKRLYELTSKWY